ncbi:hypothetical protein FS837_009200 [Tulasnella sp. UAMH 9824]|nr:hypothetical protein FS837_009200 [Tulasnella sp. UAMH 9824]
MSAREPLLGGLPIKGTGGPRGSALVCFVLYQVKERQDELHLSVDSDVERLGARKEDTHSYFKFTIECKDKDLAYVSNETKRWVKFSVSPFREPPQYNLPGGAPNEDDESKRPPEWRELAGDLAWTATFSSLTSNTAITDPKGVWNYAVFFGLTWQLWATQTTYDIKYYTNDWWHRIFFASQLGIYAVLASFSGSFNVAWKVLPGSLDILGGDSTPLAAEENAEIWIENSLRGINMTLFFSRMFLVAQYVRVLGYRPKSDPSWSWRFLLTPLATFGAGSIFFVCFKMLKDVEDKYTHAVAMKQLGLWIIAITIQILAAILTPEDENLRLESRGKMAPRLSSLTVIIMGEGLNGICSTLRNIISSLGLTIRIVSEAVTMLLVLYFIWLLYFDGPRVQHPQDKSVEEIWLWWHFPLHLSLILLLEGMKNLFIYINVLEALALLSTAFKEAVMYFNENGKFPEDSRLEKLLLVLTMSWEQEVNDMRAVISSNPTNATEAVRSQVWRWWSTVTHNVILTYNQEPDPEGEHWFNVLIGSSDAVIANDMDAGGALFDRFNNSYDELMAYSARWVITVGGIVLVCMAIINVRRRQPTNRFAWGYSLSRTVIGCLLLLIGGATSGVVMKDWYTWIAHRIPTVAIGYSLAVIVDLALLGLTVNSTGEVYVKNEKERFVQFSVNPFRLPQHNLPGGSPNKDDESERPPEWLELAGDLAWTATFSSLTSNTAVTDPNAVCNYAIFFGLTWHLWATQTTYDIKYYTNDWWHRMFFASQLGVYAVLCSFSGSFNIAWKVHPESLDIFVGNSTKLTADAMVQSQEISIEKSFSGINMTLFLSRMFLLAQYVRVLWYRRTSNQFWSRKFLLTPLATLGAGSIFLACFIMLKDLGGSRPVAFTQLCLWAIAIIIQIAAAAFTPEDKKLTLKSTSAMAPRLSTLTVIIIGEGLNAICATLRHTINSLGLTLRAVSESVTMLLILYFVWILYFDVYASVLEALARLSIAYRDVVTYFGKHDEFPDHPWIEELFLVLNMSWEQEVKDLWAASRSNSTNVFETMKSQLWRWWSTVAHDTVLLYDEQPDPEAEYWFNYFIGSSDAVVLNDTKTGELYYKFMSPYDELMGYSAHWVITAGGILLVFMAILNVMQRRPKNRFAWGYSLARAIIGCLLIIIGAATTNSRLKDWFTWIIPTVAIGYSLVVLADWILLYLSVKSIRRKEALSSSRASVAYSEVGTTNFDTSSGADFGLQPLQDVAFPDGLSPSVQSHNTPNTPSFYSQGVDGSTVYLHAAPVAGATYFRNSPTQVTAPYARGEYQELATYSPGQYHTTYQLSPRGPWRSYSDRSASSSPGGGQGY